MQLALTRHDEAEDNSFMKMGNIYLKRETGRSFLSHRSRDTKLKQSKHFKQYPQEHKKT